MQSPHVESNEHVQCSLSSVNDSVFHSDKNNDDGIHTAFIEWRDDLEILGIHMIRKSIKQYKSVLDKVIVARDIDGTIIGELDFLKEDIPIIRKVKAMHVDQLVSIGISHSKASLQELLKACNLRRSTLMNCHKKLHTIKKFSKYILDRDKKIYRRFGL